MKLEYIDDVGVLTLEHPPVNAVGLKQVLEVTELVRSLKPKTPLVLTGAGSVFCAGVDTKAFAQYDNESRAELVHGITAMVAEFLSVAAPMVAAVNGHALGGGFVLMLCADYRVAIDDSQTKLGLTEAEAGIPFPVGPMEIIRSELSPEMLRYLTLSSQILSPEAAMRSNIIDGLLSEQTLLAEAIEQARRMHAQSGFGAVKRQIRGKLSDRLRQVEKADQDPLIHLFARDG